MGAGALPERFRLKMGGGGGSGEGGGCKDSVDEASRFNWEGGAVGLGGVDLATVFEEDSCGDDINLGLKPSREMITHNFDIAFRIDKG